MPSKKDQRRVRTAIAIALFLACRVYPAHAEDVLLRWTPSSGAQGYRLYAGTKSRTYTVQQDLGLLAANTVGGVVYYLVTGPASGGRYFFAVTAYNNAGESDYSNEKQVTFAAAVSPFPTPTPTAAGTAPRGATPTRSPIGTSGAGSVRPLAITTGGADSSQLAVQYVRSPGSLRSVQLSARSVFMPVDGPQMRAALGAVEADGAADLIVWHAALTGQVRRGVVDRYRLSTDLEPEWQALAPKPTTDSGVPDDASLLVGDVDPSVAGTEVVAAGGGALGRRGKARVFGAGKDGALTLLGDFRALNGNAGTAPVHVTLGEVLGDARHAGLEIISGGARGRVQVQGVRAGKVVVRRSFRAFPDTPQASAHHLAAGNLLPTIAADEIAVGDDGTRGDGLVRVFDGSSRHPLLEFQAFPVGTVPFGIELWVGDVVSTVAGAELIVGQGAAGGTLRVFTLASGVPTALLDLPDPLHRPTSLWGHLAVGDVLPGVLGNEIVVAHSDPSGPLEVLNLNVASEPWWASLDGPGGTDPVTGVAVGP